MRNFHVTVGVGEDLRSSDIGTIIDQILCDSVPASVLSARIIVVHAAELQLNFVIKIKVEARLNQGLLNLAFS